MGKVVQEGGISETILVVDDEDMLRRLARKILEQQGYAVLEAGNAGEAQRVCREIAGPIALLLIDLVLPKINGRALANRLIAVHPEAKVLYMSGHSDLAVGVDAVLEPDANYLPKPFTAETLHQAVREVLRCG